MPSVSMSGDDTVVLNNRILVDWADNNYAELTFPNDIATAKTGKNGNSIYALNTTGRQAELKLRLMRGGNDDKFMNGLLNVQDNNFAAAVLLIGQFTKLTGDGTGKITSDTYVLAGGVFTKRVEARANAEGDTEQSVSIYTIRFTNAPRAIG